MSFRHINVYLVYLNALSNKLQTTLLLQKQMLQMSNSTLIVDQRTLDSARSYVVIIFVRLLCHFSLCKI